MEADRERRKRVVSTGNTEIDRQMGGGIPVGSLTLVEGHSGAGKSVLTQQMLWGSLSDGHDAVVFTTENTVKSLVTQMQSLNLDVSDFLLLNRLLVYPVLVSEMKEDGLAALSGAIRSAAHSGVVFVDSLTSLVAYSPVPAVMGFFEECKRLCSNELTIVVVVHSHALTESLLIRFRSLCDALLRLRIEEAGDKLLKTLEVAKVRGADKKTGNIVGFDIEPGWGMRIIPISKARA